MSLLHRPSAVPTAAGASTLASFELWGGGKWCGQGVAGVSYRETEIRALLEGKDLREGVELQTSARLLPEPANEFDANAVGVWCGGQHVGYLPREDAAKYQTVLMNLVASGLAPEVPCEIWAREYQESSWDARGHESTSYELHKRVRLDLGEPHLLVPANEPPAKAHRLLPRGPAISVASDTLTEGVISRYLRPEAACPVYAMLTTSIEQGARVSKTVVHVSLDGEPAGRLSAKMSEELAPVVNFLAEAGLTTAVRAMVRGNRLKSDLALYSARAASLDDAWFASVSDHKSVPLPNVPDRGAGSTPGLANLAPGAQSAPRLAYEHRDIPPKPSVVRFNVPPGWPAPPAGWEPVVGWTPDAAWPPAPAGWHFWVVDWWLPSCPHPPACQGQPDVADRSKIWLLGSYFLRLAGAVERLTRR